MAVNLLGTMLPQVAIRYTRQSIKEEQKGNLKNPLAPAIVLEAGAWKNYSTLMLDKNSGS